MRDSVILCGLIDSCTVLLRAASTASPSHLSTPFSSRHITQAYLPNLIRHLLGVLRVDKKRHHSVMVMRTLAMLGSSLEGYLYLIIPNLLLLSEYDVPTSNPRSRPERRSNTPRSRSHSGASSEAYSREQAVRDTIFFVVCVVSFQAGIFHDMYLHHHALD